MTWPDSDTLVAGPLNGVRILDLSRILAGPFATTILADLGADVIKVERAGEGDETRRWGPPYAASGDAAYFYVCNRGKRSVALDLRVDADREVVLRLVDDADVLVENFLPGAMDRLGLSDAVLEARNPSLVHAVVTGYGSTSSKATWPALDFVVQAHAGIIGVTGSDPADPVKVGAPVSDLSSGLYLTIGILAALRTGKGGRVEVSLVEASASLLANQAMNHLIGGANPGPRGNVHPNVAPYQTFHTADSLIAIAALSEVQFGRLCNVIGAPELATDARFASNDLRVQHREVMVDAMEARLTSRPATEWVRALNEAGVSAARINSVGELFADPDARAGLVASLPDGTPQIRTPIRLDGAPRPLSRQPPAIGEHDAEVKR